MTCVISISQANPDGLSRPYPNQREAGPSSRRRRLATLIDAAAAYGGLAREAKAMIAAGGRLVGVDNGLVEVWYRA
jgi:hypothetical protein